MKNGIVGQQDGDILKEIYRKIDIDGSLREPLTANEMVLLYIVADDIQTGKIGNLTGGTQDAETLQKSKQK